MFRGQANIEFAAKYGRYMGVALAVAVVVLYSTHCATVFTFMLLHYDH